MDLMTQVRRFDVGSLRAPKKLPNGWLRVDGYLTRSGVFSYKNPDGSERREYRPPAEVFKNDTMESFSLVPVTDDHPPGLLDAANTKQYAAGAVAGNARRDGDHVAASMLVTDATLIAKMESGKQQVSCGYICDLEHTPGEVDGQRYDAVQKNIRGNHVAIVDIGRAGPDARVRMDATDGWMTDPVEIVPAEKTDSDDQERDEQGRFAGSGGGGSSGGGDKSKGDTKSGKSKSGPINRISETKVAVKGKVAGKNFSAEYDEESGETTEITIGGNTYAADETAQMAEENDLSDDDVQEIFAHTETTAREKGKDAPTEQRSAKTEYARKSKEAMKLYLAGKLPLDKVAEYVGPKPGRRSDGVESNKESSVMKKIRIDGVEFEMSEQAAQAVDKLQAKHDQAISDLEKEKVARLDATDPVKLQARIAARVSLETSARGILGAAVKLDAMTDRDIKIAVVEKVAAIKLDAVKTDDYVQARFDSVIESANKGNPAVDATRVAAEQAGRIDAASANDEEAARKRMIEANRNRWKTPAANQ
jgi:hypothetical protein